MSNLKLGSWVKEIPGYSPSIGDTETVTLFGDAYDTIIMPDGKQWLRTNLRRDDVPYLLVPGDGETEILEYGRGYLPHIFLAWDDLPDGWRIPTKSEWEGLFAAIDCWSYVAAGGVHWVPAGTALKETGTAHWNDADGEDLHGFQLRGAGWYYTSVGYGPIHKSVANMATSTMYQESPPRSTIMQFASDLEYARVANTDASTSALTGVSIRLVRDIVPVPPTYCSGTHDIILTDSRAVLESSLAQRIDCRLRTISGEHWLNPEVGVPFFEEFLKKSPDLGVCRQLLAVIIQGTPGVQSIDRLTLSLDRSSRKLLVNFAVTGTDNVSTEGDSAVVLW